MCPAEISQDVDGIVAAHDTVPIVYDSSVHFVDVGKGTVVELEDVFMADMEIGDVVIRHEYHAPFERFY